MGRSRRRRRARARRRASRARACDASAPAYRPARSVRLSASRRVSVASDERRDGVVSCVGRGTRAACAARSRSAGTMRRRISSSCEFTTAAAPTPSSGSHHMSARKPNPRPAWPSRRPRAVRRVRNPSAYPSTCPGTGNGTVAISSSSSAESTGTPSTSPRLSTNRRNRPRSRTLACIEPAGHHAAETVQLPVDVSDQRGRGRRGSRPGRRSRRPWRAARTRATRRTRGNGVPLATSSTWPARSTPMSEYAYRRPTGKRSHVSPMLAMCPGQSS